MSVCVLHSYHFHSPHTFYTFFLYIQLTNEKSNVFQGLYFWDVENVVIGLVQ